MHALAEQPRNHDTAHCHTYQCLVCSEALSLTCETHDCQQGEQNHIFIVVEDNPHAVDLARIQCGTTCDGRPLTINVSLIISVANRSPVLVTIVT